MAEYSNGEAFIDILNAHDVDKVFINPGFEHNPIQIHVAEARINGRKSPQLILCLDEAVTIAAAYGNYMVTGKPQVVLVHSELGSLQLGGNLQNLQWGRVPVVILAAYQEIDVQRTLWNGQPYDQGSIVRNSVKYDRRLHGGEDIHEALNEVFRIACTEPTGPVYLTFPMDYLFREAEKPASLPAAAVPASLPAVDAETLNEMAEFLLAAKNPLLVSGNAGRYPENVDALIRLAETLSLPVLTGYSWMNFPGGHPLCIGIEQIGGSRKVDAGLDEADVILAIDYAMPYVRSAPPIKPETKILHIDVDPLTQGRLLWERGADLFMKADAREAIPALEKVLKEKITPEKKAELAERYRQVAARNEGIRQGWAAAAKNQANADPISADYLFYCVNQLLDEDAIVVNHTLGHCASVTEQIERTKPGTWFGCPSGAIGWAPGAALGAASASPGKTVVAVMTDGGFIWGCPTSALWTATRYRFPFLAIICNNDGYSEIRKSQKKITGDDSLGEAFFLESAADFHLDYSLTAKGAGAFGRTVTKSDEVLLALREAFAVMRGGQPAVLNVRLARDRA
jgi:acetolactate synthase-1/2/3 large subunit